VSLFRDQIDAVYRSTNRIQQHNFAAVLSMIRTRAGSMGGINVKSGADAKELLLISSAKLNTAPVYNSAQFCAVSLLTSLSTFQHRLI